MTFLKDWHLDAINFIERQVSLSGQIPSENAILEHVRFFEPKITSDDISGLKDNELFLKSMEVRGIPYVSNGLSGSSSPRQQLC